MKSGKSAHFRRRREEEELREGVVPAVEGLLAHELVVRPELRRERREELLEQVLRGDASEAHG